MVDKNESTMKWKVDISELKAAMQEAKRSISLANAEFKTATAGMDKWSKSTDGVEAKLEQLNKILPQQNKILRQLEEQYKIVSKEMGEDSAEAQRLAIQVENQRAACKKTEAQIKSYGEQLTQLEKEAKAADPAMQKLKAGLAAVGEAAVTAAKVGLAAFAAAVTAAATGLAKATVDAASFADEMITLSTVTGISTDDLQAYSYAAELVDVSLETMTGAMAKNIKSMASAQKGSKTYADAYKALGIAVTAADGSLRDSEEVFWEAIDALGQIENETERDALAMQLFGKSAQDLNPLIMAGSETMAQYAEEAKAMGAVLSDEQLLDLGAFDDSVQRLKQGATAGKRALGLILLPTLQELATKGTDLLGSFTQAIVAAAGDWGQISEAAGNLVGGFADIIMDKIPMLMQTGTAIVTAITQALIKALPKMGEALGQILPVIITGFAGLLPQLLSVGGEVIVQVMDGIAAALPDLIEMLPGIILTIATTLLQYLPQILEAGTKIIIALVTGIGSVLGNLWTKITEVAQGIWQRIAGVASQMAQVGKNIVEGLWQGISGAYTWLKNKITGWVGNVLAFIKKLFGISSPSKVMADEVGKWLPEGMAEGFERDLPHALEGMKRSLSGAIDELKEDITISTGGLLGAAQSATAGAAGAGTAAGGQTVNFTQVINSPKAVDRLTVYRETNSLLFSAKVRLNNV